MSDHYFEVAQKLEAQLAEARQRVAELEASESEAITRAGAIIGGKLESAERLAVATALLVEWDKWWCAGRSDAPLDATRAFLDDAEPVAVEPALPRCPIHGARLWNGVAFMCRCPYVAPKP